MSERAFSEARRRVVGAYRQADYQSALRIAEEAAIEFPDRADKTTYWVACLHALLGDRERALRILEDGFAQGLWWAPELLDADPDLADLRSDDRFRAIVSGSERIRASVAAGLPTDPLLRPPVEPPAESSRSCSTAAVNPPRTSEINGPRHAGRSSWCRAPRSRWA